MIFLKRGPLVLMVNKDLRSASLPLSWHEIKSELIASEAEHRNNSYVNDLISDDFQSPEDLNELFASIRTKGIDVLDRQPVLPSTASEREFGQQDVQATEEVEPELVSGALDKTDDPLRIYLRQMGLVDLLTR